MGRRYVTPMAPFVNPYSIVIALGCERCLLVIPIKKSIWHTSLSLVVLQDVAKTQGSVLCFEEVIT